MPATRTDRRPPPLHRLPPAARTVLAWSGVAAFPIVLALTAAVVGSGNAPGYSVLQSIPRYLLPALVMALPATVLRRAPLATLALMLTGSAVLTVTLHAPNNPGYLSDLRYVQVLAVDLVVGFLVATRSRRGATVAAVLALCVQVAIGFLGPSDGAPIFQPEIPTLAMIAAWVVGNSVRARRRYAETLRVQAEVQAVTAERLRIARELHDTVAHNIGVIAIQAGMGSRVIDSQPAEAGNALRVIEATSRDTLAGLRRVLGGLRQATPAPGLAELDRLVATAAAAGVEVDVRWRGERRPVPAEVGLSAYRIIQEAVTNVVRHADTPRCRVTVEHRPAELVVEVTDEGRGGPVSGTGYGITGMRERVCLLGGEFAAGPNPAGGFRVSARLPLPGSVPRTAAPDGASRPTTGSAGSSDDRDGTTADSVASPAAGTAADAAEVR